MVNYDDYLYSDFPHEETHPDRLATIATLLGLSPAPPGSCRVLELGCGLGGNLIGMAVALPGSSFVGIDRSERQVAVGQEVIAALGLTNIELRAQDILDFEEGPSSYDYAICHGIYSWVPEPVQARILQILRRHLRPQGVGYVNYNTLPGWHMRGMVRDLLRRHAGDGTGAHGERIEKARALLSLLGHIQKERSSAHAFLKGEAELLDQLADEYLFYEHLVDENRPQYFRDFARAAQDAGLQYLGDAHQQSTLPTRLGDEVLAAIPTSDVIEQEQYLDYLDVRFFRRTLLCQKEAVVCRQPTAAQLRPLWVSTRLHPLAEAPDPNGEEPEAFRGPGDRGITAYEPLLKAALWLLHERAPRGMPFHDLCAAASTWVSGAPAAEAPLEDQEQLCGSVIDLVLRGFALLGSGTPSYVTLPGQRPETTALVRLQADRGRSGCFNLRHESMAVDDLDRALLKRLDGTRDRAELTQAILGDLQAGEFGLQRDDDQPITEPDELEAVLDARLHRLASAAFLLS